MRMGFLFSEAFWGIFLILLGVTIVLKTFFGINIPLFKTAFAILLIYAGISMLAGGQRWHFYRNESIFFNNTKVQAEQGRRDYNIIFGSGTLDFTNVKPEPEAHKIEVTTVFGSGVLKVDPNIPVIIKVDAIFASAQFPDGTGISFGNYTYRSPQKRGQNEPYVEIEADVVFGSLTIVNQK